MPRALPLVPGARQMGRVVFCLVAVLLAGPMACSQKPPPPAEAAALPAEGSLEWAIAGDWRLDKERDGARHPAETLAFFGLGPGMTVVEIYPGRGWYTTILAPYLARNGGTLYAATFPPSDGPEAQATRATLVERLRARPEVFGSVNITSIGPGLEASGQENSELGPIAPAGSADLVLVMRNVHTLMAQSFAEEAFRAFYAALKPGGVLGIEEHRARTTGLQDPKAGDGYVQEAYVKALAAEAGFVFEEASEINANPKDGKDHPFGVWTLPPVLASAPAGQPANPNFDHAPYRAIGESDRMTLKFRKQVRAP